MRRLSRLTLALIALVIAVAAFVLVRRWYGSLPPVGWSSAWAYAVVVVDVALAVRIRSALGGRGIGQDRSQMHPIAVVRALALGQASALLGAVTTGAAAGLTVFLLAHRTQLAAARADLPGSIALLVGGALLVATGLWLEHTCSAPPRDDEPDALADPT